MSASLLEQLNTSAEAVGAQPVDVTQRVVDFLVRWEAHADALACLDAAGRAGQPPLPALRAAALVLRVRLAGEAWRQALVTRRRRTVAPTRPDPLVVSSVGRRGPPARVCVVPA